MITVNECPLCGASSFKSVFKAPYFRGNQEMFQIQECENCQLWITNPRPSDDELGRYYDPENYISHSNKSEGLVDRLYHLVRNYSLKKKVALISSLQKEKGRLLDYGAGTGHFLKSAQDSGWQVEGVEPSPDARKVAMETNHVKLTAPEDFQWQEETFNAITLWHVLEHLPDLQEHMQKFSAALRRNAVLVIAVPNHESADSKMYGENWAALDVPLHLYHFKKKNIEKLAAQHGLEMIEVRNMPFDSFYVSMLSEKIVNGSTNYLRAFSRGLKSNLKGFSDKNASSLIYILKKTL